MTPEEAMNILCSGAGIVWTSNDPEKQKELKRLRNEATITLLEEDSGVDYEKIKANGWKV